MMHDYLISNDFDLSEETDYSYDRINEFIDDIENPYYEERISNEEVEYYDDEIKKM